MVFPVHVVTKSAHETQGLGAKLGAIFLSKKGSELPHVLCCSGELGSGKTTFVQGLAEGLGIAKRLPSPTFVIVRRYPVLKLASYLFHFDLYRIKDQKEVSAVGFEEMLHEARSVVAIEWPERLGTQLPKKRLDIRFAALENGGHAITMTKYDR